MTVSAAVEDFETLFDTDSLIDACDHVRQAGGAPGVDGQHVAAFAAKAAEHLAALRDDLILGAYHPAPLRSLKIPKAGDPRGRELLIPTVRDRVAQRAVAAALTPRVDVRLLDVAHGYRHGRGVTTAVTRLREALVERPWVVNADVEDFFGSVTHGSIDDALRTFGVGDDLRGLVLSWLGAPALRSGMLEPRDRGLPLGAPMSPLLANVVLHRVDVALSTPTAVVVRFADDIKICTASEELAHAARAQLDSELHELGLRTNPAKTSILDARKQSFAFVGRVLRADVAGTSEQEIPTYRTLYISRDGARLLKRGERLVVRHSGTDVVVAPLRQVRQVMITAAVDLTSPALCACLRHGIDVHLADTRGRHLGCLETWKSKNPELRRRQVEVSLDDAATLKLARSFVVGKLRNQRRLLQRHAARGDHPRVTEATHRLTDALQLAARATSIDVLRGAEGYGSRAHFSGLGALLDGSWGFAGRRRRPPTDVINAMLSFGYVVLTSEVQSALAATGLDTAIGFLHTPRGGRDSLAFDLVEEFRPVVVDALVLSVAHRRVLSPDAGERDQVTGGVLLGDRHRSTFLAEYERRMLTRFQHAPSGDRVSYRRSITLQAQQLARVLFEPGALYQPIELR